MRKSILTLCLLGSTWCALVACDACGCGVGQINWGLSGFNQLNHVGAWWNHQRYRSHAADAALPGSEEQFNTFELRGRFRLGRRWQVSAIVPIAMHQRRIGAETATISGLADVAGLLQYHLIQRGTAEQAVRQQLSLGAGVKAPTGRFDLAQGGGVGNPNFQLGTGSWDALLSATYLLVWREWGLYAEAGHQRGHTNADEYRFGNRSQLSLQAFRVIDAGKGYTWMPAAGLRAEHTQRNVDRNYYVTHSGGQALLASLGLECYTSRYAVGASWQQPLRTQWGSDLVSFGPRVSLHANVFF